MAKGGAIKEKVGESKERTENFQWLASQNLTEYEGLWIGVVNKHIICANKQLKKVMDATRAKCPGKVPFITKVPVGIITT